MLFLEVETPYFFSENNRVGQEQANGLASPELRDSNSSLHRAQSMDTNQWSGIKLGRQRASSVWSANSTALRVSITKALNQRTINGGTARRPTTTTLLSLNPPGLRNGKVYFLNLEGCSSTGVRVFLIFPFDFLIGFVTVI